MSVKSGGDGEEAITAGAMPALASSSDDASTTGTSEVAAPQPLAESRRAAASSFESRRAGPPSDNFLDRRRISPKVQTARSTRKHTKYLNVY